MKTVALLLSLGFIFLLIASCEQNVSIENNGSVQDAFANKSSANIIKPDSCCDTISHSKKGEIDFKEEARIINCKQTIKEGKIELLTFVSKFEKLSASISDADLLVLGKKYLEKIEAGGSFTKDQIQTVAKLLLSSSVSTFANCIKLANDKPQLREVKQFYYKNMFSTNKSFYVIIKNKNIIDALKENKGFAESEEYKKIIESKIK